VDPIVTPPAPPDTFWALTGADWAAITAIATIALILATLILAWVAYVQIGAAREEAREAHEETRNSRTLTLCVTYDLDPVLDAVCRRLTTAYESGELKSDPNKFRVDLYSLFNFLENLAIGIRSGLYNGGIVRDMMEPIFLGYVQDYIESGIAGWDPPPEGEEEYFHRLRDLCREWKANPKE
jgi:hypothetical protein